jgi:short-subunit dehydrogenase
MGGVRVMPGASAGLCKRSVRDFAGGGLGVSSIRRRRSKVFVWGAEWESIAEGEMG